MKSRSLSVLFACSVVFVLGLSLVGQGKDGDKAPDVFQAKFETTTGDFVIEVHREWAPLGADRFYELVKSGFLTVASFSACYPILWRNLALMVIPKSTQNGELPLSRMIP